MDSLCSRREADGLRRRVFRNKKACLACGKLARYACGVCKTAKYCSRECQKLHWEFYRHRDACGIPPSVARHVGGDKTDEPKGPNMWMSDATFEDILAHQARHILGEVPYDVDGNFRSWRSSLLTDEERNATAKFAAMHKLGLFTTWGQIGRCGPASPAEAEYYQDRFFREIEGLERRPKWYDEYCDLIDMFDDPDYAGHTDAQLARITELEPLADEYESHRQKITDVYVYEKYFLTGICRTDLAKWLKSELEDRRKLIAEYGMPTPCVVYVENIDYRGSVTFDHLVLIGKVASRTVVGDVAKSYGFVSRLDAKTAANPKFARCSAFFVHATSFCIDFTDAILKALRKYGDMVEF